MAEAPPPPEDDAPGVPEWVVTYGDMMSLLLTFFIMLVSMSELKQDGSMRAALDAIKESFGATAGEYGAPGKSFQEVSQQSKAASRGARSEGGAESASRDSKGRAGPNPTAERISHNNVITLGGPSHFARFSADLTPDLRDALKQLFDVVVTRNQIVMIRGHASPEPLPDGAEFGSQMELSFARARNTANYLLELGLPQDRLVISAVGASEPRTRSRVPAEQAWNRRVDIFLTDFYTDPADDPEATGTPAPEG